MTFRQALVHISVQIRGTLKGISLTAGRGTLSSSPTGSLPFGLDIALDDLEDSPLQVKSTTMAG